MKSSEPFVLVIFGASGDLTKRKLIPALYNLFAQNRLAHNRFVVLGASRTNLTDSEFRKRSSEFLTANSKTDEFLEHLFYEPIQPTNGDEYLRLKERIIQLQKSFSIGENIIFYLSTPPSLYSLIPKYLASVGLNNELKGFSRLIIEKPFGDNLQSAKLLNKELLQFFNEEQLYRIDHYLGKETVQNLLVLRFSNSILEPLWNHKYIDHVQITSSESLGVESRGEYYDKSGAMRDMLQNHLMQLVGLIAMEPPVVIEADAIRNEMLKVFQSIRPFNKEMIKANVLRGQYTSSTIKGLHTKGYREETGVDMNSRTETFAIVKLNIDNWRWGGIPFYIRTGKRLPSNVTEIVINFKPTPHHLFCDKKEVCQSPNQLIIRIQPDEGVLLKMGLKIPGSGFNVQNVNMDFHYSDISKEQLPTAYQRLLLDCANGDATLYARGDNVEKAWEVIQPIIDEWDQNDEFPLYGYPAGTWGPLEADSLLENEKFGWRYPCKNLANDGEYCEL